MPAAGQVDLDLWERKTMISCCHLTWCAWTLLFLPSAVRADDIVFKKSFPNRQTMVVTRHEIPTVPLSPKFLKSLPANVSLSKPDHTYLYSFDLRTLGQANKSIWQHKVEEYDGFEVLYGKWQMFDAVVEAKTVVVSFKQAGETYANIFTPDVKGDYQPMRWQDTVLQVDSATFGPIATGAVIEGSLKAGTLEVIVTSVASAEVLKKMGGPRIRYVLRNGKWVKVGPLSEAASGTKLKPAAK